MDKDPKNPFEDRPGFRWPFQFNITIKPLQERHFVTLAVFLLAAGMFLMARENPDLWDVELFKILIQAVIISGIIGSILSFHFSANKGDEAKADNTAKAFEAIRATASVAGSGTVEADRAAAEAASRTAAAAEEQARREGDATK